MFHRLVGEYRYLSLNYSNSALVPSWQLDLICERVMNGRLPVISNSKIYAVGLTYPVNPSRLVRCMNDTFMSCYMSGHSIQQVNWNKRYLRGVVIDVA